MKKILLLTGMFLAFFFVFTQSNKAYGFEVPFKSDTEVPRYVLLEGFTASTCGPCYSGNINLKNVLAQNDAVGGKYTLIKYQTGGPSPGDPYYTQEVGQRGSFYSNMYVPWLYRDGTQNGNTGSFTHAQLLNLQSIPSFVEVKGVFNVEGQTVTSTITVRPTEDITGGNNLRLFVAIVEKETYNNKKTNGETVFHQVMKKFMPNASGIILGDLTANVIITHELEWEFKGEYRLPPNASQPINHDIEHSVEDFDNLEVVAWVQNIATKVVYNSGTAVKGGVIIPTYPVTFNVVGENGSLIATVDGETINSGVELDEGKVIDFTATPDENFEVKEWKLNGVPVPDNTTNNYSITVSESSTVTVEFISTHPTTYTINASAGENGAIAPEGEKEYSAGESATYTFIPDENYEVEEVFIDGEPMGLEKVTEYVFSEVNKDYIIHVTFRLIQGIKDVNGVAISVAPNPVKDKLYVTGIYDKLEIISVSGQVLATVYNQPSIDVNHLAKGIYFVKIQANGQISTFKVVNK